MMYTAYPTYVLRDDGACIPLSEGNSDYQDYLTWVAAGNTPNYPPAPTFTQYYATYLGNFSQWLQDTAAGNGYDSAISCISYENSTIPQYAGDAVAMRKWRDALWQWAYQWQAGFNGQLPTTIPTWEEVKAQAPQPAAYGWVVHDPSTLAGQTVSAV